MIFGASCSPSIAQYVKNENANRFVDCYPRAVKAITENTYVDDLLDSVDTPDEAIQLAKSIRFIHSEGGFLIRNWRSNCRAVQEALEAVDTTGVKSMDQNSSVEKVLGMFWVTDEDNFTFSLQFTKGNNDVLQAKRRATKRELLKIQMSFYDPLGLIAHYIVKLKIIVQSLWRSGSDWDTELTDEHQQRFEKWLTHLPEIEELRIPRCYLQIAPDWQEMEVELHVFVDASKDAYASAAYLRLTTTKHTDCVLVSAKTRVAPIKLESIPRLELDAARLGVRHAKIILKSLTVSTKRVTYWSDSETVLIWLRSDARSNPSYVAFRITEIQDSSDVASWRYVPSSQNVADDATKDKEKYVIHNSNRWYRGPDFLYKPEEE